MKIEAKLIVAVHETKYGTDIHVRQVQKDDDINILIDEMAADCKYEEGTAGEYFDADIRTLVIDTDECKTV